MSVGEIAMSTDFVDDPDVAGLLRPEFVRRRQLALKGYSDPVTIAQFKP